MVFAGFKVFVVVEDSPSRGRACLVDTGGYMRGLLNRL
jgi:hypothetical protein